MRSALSHNVGAVFFGASYLEDMLADVGVTVAFTHRYSLSSVAVESERTLTLAADLTMGDRCRIMFETWLRRVTATERGDSTRLTRQPIVIPSQRVAKLPPDESVA